MSLSLSMCLLTIALIKHQFDYDKNNEYKEDIYRINTFVSTKSGQNVGYATTPQPLIEELRNDSGIGMITPIKPTYDATIETNRSTLHLRGVFSVDSYFKMFSFDLFPEANKNSLQNPRNIILSEESATKLFGKSSPIGKILKINDWGNFVVANIFKKQNLSHIEADFILSYKYLKVLEASHKIESIVRWNNYASSYLYIQLNKGIPRKHLVSRLEQISRSMTKRFSFQGEEKSISFIPQALTAISPSKGLLLDNSRALSYSTIVILLLVIMTLMGVTCFNFSSLTIARALTRAKEIGIRKVMGATRKQVLLQFMIEAVVFALISFFISLLILPFIPLNESLAYNFRYVKIDIPLILFFIFFSVFSGLFAGLIPGLILSNFKPVQVLKSLRGVKLIKGLGFRKLLIASQFTVSVVLIFILLVVRGQSKYMADADYGFDIKNIVSINIPDPKLQFLIKNKLEEFPEVTGISSLSTNFGYQPTDNLKAYSKSPDNSVNLDCYYADENLINLFNLKLIAGTNFSADSSINANSVIINEKAIGVLNLISPESAVGKSIWINDTTKYIAGVVRDFHYKNFKSLIGPMVLQYDTKEFKLFNARLHNTNDLVVFNSKLTNLSNQLGLKERLEYSVYKQVFVEQQQHTGDVVMLGFVAIMFLGIANLGLLGMASYSTEQRIKEVSIRKILGASPLNVFYVLSKEFLLLISIGLLIGLPVGFIISNIFLVSFSYKVEVGLNFFLLTAIFIFTVCLIMIGSQTLKSSISKPISHLD